MLFSRAALLAAVLAAAALPARAFDDARDAKLKEALTVKDVQGGFAGFTGKQVTVQPSGKWVESSVFNRKDKPLRSGTLDKKALAKLAAEVARYSPGTLKSTGKPTTNPRVITVSYGRNTATLNLPTTGELPKPNPKTAAGRFGGVVAAVQKALPKAKGAK